MGRFLSNRRASRAAFARKGANGLIQMKIFRRNEECRGGVRVSVCCGRNSYGPVVLPPEHGTGRLLSLLRYKQCALAAAAGVARPPHQAGVAGLAGAPIFRIYLI